MVNTESKDPTKTESKKEKVHAIDYIKLIEDKFVKSTNETDKLKKDLKSGLADVEQAIEMLQKVIEGKIKISEDKLEKEIEKIKKMVVLM